MKVFIVVILLAFSPSLYSQSSELQVWRYADLTYPLGGFTSKSKVDVDYGESVTGWGKVPERLEDETGKQVKFKSPADALNWMSDRGWELVQSYQTDEDLGFGTKLKYLHFIMRRLDVKKKP